MSFKVTEHRNTSMSFKVTEHGIIPDFFVHSKKRKTKCTSKQQNVLDSRITCSQGKPLSGNTTLCNYDYENSRILIDPSHILCHSVGENNKLISCDLDFADAEKGREIEKGISCLEVSHACSTVGTSSFDKQNILEFQDLPCCKSCDTRTNFVFTDTSVKVNRNLVNDNQDNSFKSDILKSILKNGSHAFPFTYGQERKSNEISFNNMDFFDLSLKQKIDFQGERNEANYKVGSMESAQPVCDKNQIDTSLAKPNAHVYQTEYVPSCLSVVHHPTSTVVAVTDKENQLTENLAKNKRTVPTEHWTVQLKRKGCEFKEGEVCQGNVKKNKIAPIKLVKNTCCSVPSKKSVEAGKNDSCVEISPSEPITKTSSSYSKQDNTELRNEKCIDASLIPMSLAKGAEKEAANQSSRKISMSEQICAFDQNSASSKSQEDDPSEEVEKSSNICIKSIGKATQHNLKDFLNVSSNFISVKNHNEHISKDTFDNLREEKSEDKCDFPSPKCKKKALNENMIKLFVHRSVATSNCNNSCNENMMKSSKVLVPEHSALKKKKLSTSETKLFCQDVEKGNEKISGNPLEKVVDDFLQCPLNNGHTFHAVAKRLPTEVRVDNSSQDLKNFGRKSMVMSEHAVLQKEELNTCQEKICPVSGKLKENMSGCSVKEVHDFVHHSVCDGIATFSEKHCSKDNVNASNTVLSEYTISSMRKQATIKKIVYQDNEKLDSIPPKNSIHGNSSDIALHSLDNALKLSSRPEVSLVKPQGSCEINGSNQGESLIAFKDSDKAQCFSIDARFAANPEDLTNKSEFEVDDMNSISFDKTSCGDQENHLVCSSSKVVLNKSSEHEYNDEIYMYDEVYGFYFVYRKSFDGLICMTVPESSCELESCNDVTSKEQFSSDEESLPSTNVQSETEEEMVSNNLCDVASDSCKSGLAITSVYSISDFPSSDKVRKNLDVDTYPNKSSNDFDISSSQMLDCNLSVFNDTVECIVPVPASMATSSMNFDENNLRSDKTPSIVNAEHELDTFTEQNFLNFSNKEDVQLGDPEKIKAIKCHSNSQSLETEPTVKEPNASGVVNEANTSEASKKFLFTSSIPTDSLRNNKAFFPTNDLRNQGNAPIIDYNLNSNCGNEVNDVDFYSGNDINATRLCLSKTLVDPKTTIGKESSSTVMIPANSNKLSESSYKKTSVSQDLESVINDNQSFNFVNETENKELCMSRLSFDINKKLVSKESLPTIMMPAGIVPLNESSFNKDFLNEGTGSITVDNQSLIFGNMIEDEKTYASRVEGDPNAIRVTNWSAHSTITSSSTVLLNESHSLCQVKMSLLKNCEDQDSIHPRHETFATSSSPANTVFPGLKGVKSKDSNQMSSKKIESEEVEIIEEILVKPNKSLQSVSDHSILTGNIQNPRGNFECLEPSCICCRYLETKREFIFYVTRVLSEINSHITCKTINVIFIVDCASCEKQYFCFSEESTLEQCLERILGRISSKQHSENEEDCVKHFKQEGHKGDLKIYGIDANIRSKRELEKRRNFWLTFLYPVQID